MNSAPTNVCVESEAGIGQESVETVAAAVCDGGCLVDIVMDA